ncbi:hypothetical protein [Hymenobacter arizonensis]|nr:hypothetical protein [Hymenobacter arizonensis]
MRIRFPVAIKTWLACLLLQLVCITNARADAWTADWTSAILVALFVLALFFIPNAFCLWVVIRFRSNAGKAFKYLLYSLVPSVITELMALSLAAKLTNRALPVGPFDEYLAKPILWGPKVALVLLAFLMVLATRLRTAPKSEGS